jgi:hypothetical protein
VQVDIGVDRFHFKSHKGAWCHANVNPYSNRTLLELDKQGSTNLSLAEQLFSKIARLKHFMQYMHQVRFSFMLTKLADLDMGRPADT